MGCIAQEILTLSDTSPLGESCRKKEDKDTYGNASGGWRWRTQEWEGALEARTENSNKSWSYHTAECLPKKVVPALPTLRQTELGSVPISSMLQ